MSALYVPVLEPIRTGMYPMAKVNPRFSGHQ